MSVSNKHKEYTDVIEKIHELVDADNTMKKSLEIMIDCLYKKNKENKELRKRVKELEDQVQSAFMEGYDTALDEKAEDEESISQ
jgi:polyhydroxyalkanoate synthesis regulator phasin